jgi:hypothetical protein
MLLHCFTLFRWTIWWISQCKTAISLPTSDSAHWFYVAADERLISKGSAKSESELEAGFCRHCGPTQCCCTASNHWDGQYEGLHSVTMPSHCPQVHVHSGWSRKDLPNLSKKLASAGAVNPSNAATLHQIIEMDKKNEHIDSSIFQIGNWRNPTGESPFWPRLLLCVCGKESGKFFVRLFD